MKYHNHDGQEMSFKIDTGAEVHKDDIQQSLSVEELQSPTV